jgi:type IX secretion system PorP/SprF family membrane protein
MHTPLRNKKIGIGISVINDVIGPDRNTGFYVDYSYKLRINKKAQLGLGLKAGLSLLKSSLASLDLDDSSDPVFNNDVTSKLLPNFGFGAYYYTDKWYVGFSIPRLLENNYSDNSIEGSTDIFGDGKHYYFIGGANFKIADKIDLRPVSLIKINSGAPIEIDLTAMFVYDNKFSLGIMGRSGDAVGILASIMVLEQLEVGYSFDWSFINATKVYNAGSHEIFLRYDLVFKNEARIHSPRYF